MTRSLPFLVLCAASALPAFACIAQSLPDGTAECLARIDQQRYDPAPRPAGDNDVRPALLGDVCPEVAADLEDGAWGEALPGLDDLSTNAFVALTEVAARYERPPARDLPADALDAAVAALQLQEPVQALSIWQRIGRWFNEHFGGQREGGKNWLERWLGQLSLPERVVRYVVFALGVVLVLVTIGIIVNELRVAGVFAGGVLRKYSPLVRDASGEAVRGLDFDDLWNAPLSRRPALLLRLVLERIAAQRAEPLRASLTHRELLARTAGLSGAQSDSFAVVIAAAERVTFGGWRPDEREVDAVLARGRTLLESLAPAEGGRAMRDRLVTLLGALAALAIVYGLFLKRPGESPVTRPVSDEAGRNGYLALRNWLEQAAIPVVSLRERFPKLRDDAGFGGGNILVTTMPYYTPLRTSEIQPLQDWVEDGNTVLILAALDDTPEWSPVTIVSSLRDELGRLTGLSYISLREEALAARAETQRAANAPRPRRLQIDPGTTLELEASGAHPLLENVAKLRGYSDQPSDLMRVRGGDPYRLVLRLATESSSGLDALWQLPRGRGQIIVSASGSLLVNRNIASEDARQFVRNLVRYHLGAGGSVIFDDMHQGVSALYDPAALFRDARLSYTLWFVVAAWLVYILGSSNRLAPPLAPRTAPKQGDFLAAAGGFMARRLDRRAAGLLLIEEWLDEVRRLRGLPRGAPLWTELEAAPTLAREIFKELHGYHRQLADGGKVSLVQLHNVLKQAREAVG